MSYLDVLYDELRRPLPIRLDNLLRKREEMRLRMHQGTPGSTDWQLKSRYIEDIDKAIEIAQRNLYRNREKQAMERPIVDLGLVQTLLASPEDTWLDWKTDFPKEMMPPAPADRDIGKGKLLKDIVSIANSLEDKPGYLVYGVRDLKTKREVTGISRRFDDAMFQTWCENTFYPPVNFFYTEIEWEASKTIGVFTLMTGRLYPHVCKQTVGNIIYEGQVWFRRGSKNTVAIYSELSQMFVPEPKEPIRITRHNDAFLKTIVEDYKKQGREAVLPGMGKKQSKIAQGFEIARYPSTGQEIWVGQISADKYEHILMLKPIDRKE